MGKRQALRQRFGLEEDCNDCVATTFCAPCAMCQEARELKLRLGPSGGRYIYKTLYIIEYNLDVFSTSTYCNATTGSKYVSNCCRTDD